MCKSYDQTWCSDALFNFVFLFSFFLAKDTDIIDEAIYYFKANVFFKNYEIKVIFFSFAIVPLL